MRISLNWLKKYVNIPISDEELIRLIGSRLVEVEGVIDETHKYDNIYIVRVNEATKIPDTHLTLCMIDVGEKELVQVVCGAPNVQEGMLAVWIKPGAIVPASVHEDAPFEIGKRKMRGYESCGMLAGADELDFGDDHSGIVEINPSMAKPGDLLADIFELNDLILEIENKSLTHRPDTFGIIGFAREVAGILGIKFNAKDFNNDFNIDNNIKIDVDKNICDRYTAVVLEKHGEIEKKYLSLADTLISKSGMKPISPIVDATNYLMLLTEQPLHAFDYDKFIEVGGNKKPHIVVRLANKGEKIVLLDDTEVELNESDIIICSEDVPVALAGAMGGKSTMITENTRNVILESATFSLYNLRKTQMSHGIFSEAITRFTKGQPSFQTLQVAEECADLLSSGFKVTSVSDKIANSRDEIRIKIKVDEINGLLGTDYSKELIIKTLENVGFIVKGDEAMDIIVPVWRTDIHIKEDIIEEVGRLLGYDNINPTLPLHYSASKNDMLELKREIREKMLRFGANEVLTYSFVSDKLLEKVGQDKDNSYRIINSISPELQFIRQSLVPSLLQKAYLNEKLPVDKFAIYEMNKVFQKKYGFNNENIPIEKMQMGFVVAERKNKETAYYKAKKYADELLKEFGIDVEYSPLKEDSSVFRPFEKKRSAEIRLKDDSNVLIGVVGEFKNSVKYIFKLSDYVAGFEIDLDLLLKYKAPIKPLKRTVFKDQQDLTITTEKTYAEITSELEKKYPNAMISPVTIYKPEGKVEKNITVHLDFYE